MTTTRWNPDIRPNLRLDEALARSARDDPTNEAVVDYAGRTTYSQLEADVDVLAGDLRRAGVGPGIRVAVWISGSKSGITLFYALSRAQAVAVPMNPYWVPHEAADALRRSRASFLLCSDLSDVPCARAARNELGSAIRPGLGVVERASVRVIAPAGPLQLTDDTPETALLLFTSGSTATPKGALLTHDGLVGTAYFYTLALEVVPEDRYMVLLPLYHVAGIVDCLLMMHLVGGTCVVLPTFDSAQVLQTLDIERITITGGFDAMFNKLEAVPGYSPDRHRFLKKAAMAGTERTYDRLHAKGVELIVPSYGLTECCSGACVVRPEQSTSDRRGTVGLPFPGLRCAIFDPETSEPLETGQRGEIRLQGWNLLQRYIDDASAFDDGGWFRTGDLGELLPSGSLAFRGRLKQMVKSGGENVSEHEVEVFLVDHFAGIRQAAVVGVPDEEWGEMVVAFIEWQGSGRPDLARLRAECKAGLAAFKVPKRIWTIEPGGWPLMPAGKVDKLALRARATELASERESAVAHH